MSVHVYVFLLVVCLLLFLALLWRFDWFHLRACAPDDCPACRRASTPSSIGGLAPAPVCPWREVKSRRGACICIPTEGFACPNRRCAYFDNTDAREHALVGGGQHGRAERIQTFRCQACHATFSARFGTPLYRLKTPSSRVAMVLSALDEGLDPSAAERVFGYYQATITRWLTRAGQHTELFHERSLRNLLIQHLQLDEIRTRLRSSTQVRLSLAGH